MNEKQRKIGAETLAFTNILMQAHDIVFLAINLMELRSIISKQHTHYPTAPPPIPLLHATPLKMYCLTAEMRLLTQVYFRSAQAGKIRGNVASIPLWGPSDSPKSPRPPSLGPRTPPPKVSFRRPTLGGRGPPNGSPRPPLGALDRLKASKTVHHVTYFNVIVLLLGL